MMLAIDQIRVGKRLRQMRPERIAELAESIGKLGLMVPIGVTSTPVKRANGGAMDVAFDLVAGLHRLEACKSLGWTEIETSVLQLNATERELWEIDENLIRAELNQLERGEHLMRRKEIYEKKYPQAKEHAAGAAAAHGVMGHATALPAVASFAADVGAKIGLAERTIRENIARARKIEPKLRDRVRALPAVADSGPELDALARLKPDEQKAAIALVETGKASGIRAARKMLQLAPAVSEDMAREKRRAEFMRVWQTLDEADRIWAGGTIVLSWTAGGRDDGNDW